MKSRDGKSQGREEKNKEDQRREIQKKEDPGARKDRKVAIHRVFPMICGSGGSKSRLAKAACAEPCGQMRDEKLHAAVARSTFASQCTKHATFRAVLEVEMLKKRMPLWRESDFEVNMHKTHHVQSTFWRWDVQRVHAAVARSRFRSQHAQNTPRSEHFLTLRCSTSARGCGAKHISKSKVQEADGYGALFDVQMSFRVAGARDCAPCQNMIKTWRISSISQNEGRRGTFEEDLERCSFRVRRSKSDLSWFITLWSFRSYTTTKTGFVQIVWFLCNWNGKMKNQTQIDAGEMLRYWNGLNGQLDGQIDN